MSKKPKARPLGCALVVLAAVGLIVVVGLWLGGKKDAGMSPCERYARNMATSLDNCHSGVNRNLQHHMAVCEQSVDPSPECLAEIRRLSREACHELERGPIAAGEICRKKD